MYRPRSAFVAALAAAALILPVTGSASSVQAAGSIRSAVALNAPASGLYGSYITLTGRLWRYGTAYGIRGAVVWLQRSPHGRNTWANLTATQTGTNGSYRFSVQQLGAFDYRAYYAGSATFTGAYSPVRHPVTQQKVLLDSLATTNHSTGTLRASGRIFPAPPNGTIGYLQRWVPEYRIWHTVAAGRASAGRIGITATRPGSVASYRIVAPARASYGAGVSSTRSLTHYVWRGGFVRGGLRGHGSGEFDLGEFSPTPPRGQVDFTVFVNRYFSLAVTARGCRAAVADTTSNVQMPIRLIGPTAILDTATVPANGTPVRMTAQFAPDSSHLAIYLDNMANATQAKLGTNLAMLCAN